jgi:hypothetical protein
MKIAINTEIGGFHLSYWAMKLLYWKKGSTVNLYQEERVYTLPIGITVYKEGYIEDGKIETSFFYKLSTDECNKFSRRIGAHYFETDVDSFSSDNFPSRVVSPYDFKRDDPDIVEVIELLGDNSSDDPGDIKIVEIPEGTSWYIDEDDTGCEWVAETHRTWRYCEKCKKHTLEKVRGVYT